MPVKTAHASTKWCNEAHYTVTTSHGANGDTLSCRPNPGVLDYEGCGYKTIPDCTCAVPPGHEINW